MKILKKNKLKILNFSTELILSILLLSIFSFSFFFSMKLNPLVKKADDSVLGVNSRELSLLDDINISFKVITADSSNVEADIKLEGIREKIINDYKFVEIKNPNDYAIKYLLYFDLEQKDYENLKLLMVNDKNESIIYDSSEDSPKIIDQTIEIVPKSLVRFSLRTIALSEDIPESLDLNVKVKLISSKGL